MREKFICAHFATSYHGKIGSKARFFASSPPCDFPPKTALFRPIRPLLGQKPPFSGHLFLLRTGFSHPKSLFSPKKSVWRGVFVWNSPEFRLWQARKRRKQAFFLPPPLHSKNTSRLSLKTSPLFATSSLVSSQTSPPLTNPLSPYAQDTRLRVYTRSRSQRICHFCLHPSPHPSTNCISAVWVWRQALPSPSHSPQQSEFQHLAQHPFKKTGERKRVKPSHVTHNRSRLYTQKVKRWRQK